MSKVAEKKPVEKSKKKADGKYKRGATTNLFLPAWWRKVLLENIEAKRTDAELTAMAHHEFGKEGDRITPKAARAMCNLDRKRGRRKLNPETPEFIEYKKEG